MNDLPADLARVGKHFLIGLQKSVTLTEHDVRLLTALQPAGIILFRDNFKRGVPYEEWLAAYRELIDRARDCVHREKLLISIDHECGAVFRPPPPITNFGPAATWAARSAVGRNSDGRRTSVTGHQSELRAGGGYSHQSRESCDWSSRFRRRGQRGGRNRARFSVCAGARGVLACPKHFPGHGDTSVDSHYQLPVVQPHLGRIAAARTVAVRGHGPGRRQDHHVGPHSLSGNRSGNPGHAFALFC